jgi:transcriptional regulator with XRE-family HTH domain
MPVIVAPTGGSRQPDQPGVLQSFPSNRKRLGLSAADFGLLVGASGQSVYAWEQGKARPRGKNLAAIAALRGVGKREVVERLAALKSGEQS